MALEIRTDFLYARHEQRFTSVKINIGRNLVSRVAHWQPDTDQQPHPYVPDIPFEDGWIDLHDLSKSEGLNVLVHGAEYTFTRADEDNVKLWSSYGGTHNRWLPYIGQIVRTGIVDSNSYDPSIHGEDFYPGIIATRSAQLSAAMDMPLFDYDKQGKLRTPVVPDGDRSGAVLGLRVFDLTDL